MVPGEVRDEVVQDAPVPLVLLEQLRELRRPREDRGPLAGGADGRCVRLQVLVVPQARARAAVLHESFSLCDQCNRAHVPYGCCFKPQRH